MRPHLKQFLKDVARRYEIIIYTDTDIDYSNFVIDYIEEQYDITFAYRLYDEQCVTQNDICMFKCLNILSKGRSLRDLIIVDDRVQNYAFSLRNGVPIKPYDGSNEDNELMHLAKYLRKLAQKDIAKQVEEDFAGCLLNP